MLYIALNSGGADCDVLLGDEEDLARVEGDGVLHFRTGPNLKPAKDRRQP